MKCRSGLRSRGARLGELRVAAACVGSRCSWGGAMICVAASCAAGPRSLGPSRLGGGVRSHIPVPTSAPRPAIELSTPCLRPAVDRPAWRGCGRRCRRQCGLDNSELGRVQCGETVGYFQSAAEECGLVTRLWRAAGRGSSRPRRAGRRGAGSGWIWPRAALRRRDVPNELA